MHTSTDRCRARAGEALKDFITDTECNEDHRTENEDDFLGNLANAAIEKQGILVLSAVTKLVNNHLKRDFSKTAKSLTDENLVSTKW